MRHRPRADRTAGSVRLPGAPAATPTGDTSPVVIHSRQPPYRSLFSRGISVLLDRRRADSIESAGEPLFCNQSHVVRNVTVLELCEPLGLRFVSRLPLQLLEALLELLGE